MKDFKIFASRVVNIVIEGVCPLKHSGTMSAQPASEAFTSASRLVQGVNFASNVTAANVTNNDRSAFGPWTIPHRNGRRTRRMTAKGTTGISPPKPNVVVTAGDRGRPTVSNRTVTKNSGVGPSPSKENGRIYGTRFSVLDAQGG